MAENEFVDDCIHTWITILFISTCIISITLNTIVLALSTFSLKWRRQKNPFVINLELTDTFSAFVLIGHLFLDTLWWLEPLFYSLLVACVRNILAVALDRSIALKWAPQRHDLRYKTPTSNYLCFGLDFELLDLLTSISFDGFTCAFYTWQLSQPCYCSDFANDDNSYLRVSFPINQFCRPHNSRTTAGLYSSETKSKYHGDVCFDPWKQLLVLVTDVHMPPYWILLRKLLGI